ncbi:hypothetical protein TNCV_1584991 [Trichonephila clavipes]|nr:hypothetical protein TNCV_1584991 [Trichonephila clavipes]
MSNTPKEGKSLLCPSQFHDLEQEKLICESTAPGQPGACCVHLSIRDLWALKCMSRCPDQVVSLKVNPQCLVSKQACDATVHEGQSLLCSTQHEQMFRSGGQSDAKSPVLSSQEGLIFIYGPTEGMKGRVNLVQPVVWICGVETRCTNHITAGFQNINK